MIGPTTLPNADEVRAALPEARHSVQAIQQACAVYLRHGMNEAARRAPVSRGGLEYWLTALGLTRTPSEAKVFACVSRMADHIGEDCPRRALRLFAREWRAGTRSAELCRRFGICKCTVRRLAARLGLPPRRQSPRTPRPLPARIAAL